MSILDEDNHDSFLKEGETPPLTILSKPRTHRKSMDIEFHGLNLDDLDVDDGSEKETKKKNNSGPNNRSSNGRSNVGNDASSSSDDDDDDTFGEASVDCEPDQQYLEELLDEEYHPERVNLLDGKARSRKSNTNHNNGVDHVDPRSQFQRNKNGITAVQYYVSDSDDDDDNDKKKKKDNKDSDYDYDDTESDEAPESSNRLGSDISDPRLEYDVELSDHPDNEGNDHSHGEQCDDNYDDCEGDLDRTSETDNGNDGKAEETSPDDSEEGGDEKDTFKCSPPRSRSLERPRPNLMEQFQIMGKSTKKSFRTVGNKSFWSQPFKGLARVGSGRRKKKPIMEQEQEVA